MNGELFVHSYVPTRGRPENIVVRRIKYGELNGSASAVNFSVRTYECTKLTIGVAISKIDGLSVRSYVPAPRPTDCNSFGIYKIWRSVEDTLSAVSFRRTNVGTYEGLYPV